jgi:hypothetical protein
MMRFKLGLVVVAMWTILLSQAVEAQTVPGDVTFEVPVNLTRLWGEITKVAVWCKISSEALIGTRNKQLQAQLELPVAAGQLVTTARVVVIVSSTAFTDPTMKITGSPIGQPATYQCSLSGFSMLPTTNGGGWNVFSADSTNPAFRLTPTPAPIGGNFVW